MRLTGSGSLIEIVDDLGDRGVGVDVGPRRIGRAFIVGRLVVRRASASVPGSASAADWWSNRGSARCRPAAASAFRSACRRFRRAGLRVVPGTSSRWISLSARAGVRDHRCRRSAPARPAKQARSADGHECLTAGFRRRFLHQAISPGAAASGRLHPSLYAKLRLEYASMPQQRALEFAGDDFFAHAVQQRQRRLLAAERVSSANAVASAASAMISGSMPAERPSAQASLWLSTAVRRFSSRTSASMSLRPCSMASVPPFSSANPNRSDQLDMSL